MHKQPQSNRLLLLSSGVMATLVDSSAVLLFPCSKSFLPVPLPPTLLLHWSQRPNEVIFLMPPSTITSLFVSWASVSCWRLAWAYDPTPTECFLPFKPPYIKGSRAGHMPLCVLMPLQTKNPCGQSQLMLNEVENNNPRTGAATVT